LQDHGRNMDYDDSKIDDDLDKLLQHIKEEQQNSLVSHCKHVGMFWGDWGHNLCWQSFS
jgi:hypothetical protein